MNGGLRADGGPGRHPQRDCTFPSRSWTPSSASPAAPSTRRRADRAACPICEDERQYVGYGGQRWTTLAELARDHRNRIRGVEPGLPGIGTAPPFAIGQRALLVARRPSCGTASACRRRPMPRYGRPGGVDAIAISHPHFYASMVEWAHVDARDLSARGRAALGDAARPGDRVLAGEPHVGDGLTLSAAAATSRAARCSTGRAGPAARARCCRVTPSMAVATAAGSASCAATPT